MRTVLVAASPDHCGLLPRKLRDIYIPRGKPLPKTGEPVKLVEETTGELLTQATVDGVDVKSRTYDVQVW